jgi:hypothetical protein
MGRSGCERSLTHQSTEVEQHVHITAIRSSSSGCRRSLQRAVRSRRHEPLGYDRTIRCHFAEQLPELRRRPVGDVRADARVVVSDCVGASRTGRRLRYEGLWNRSDLGRRGAPTSPGKAGECTSRLGCERLNATSSRVTGRPPVSGRCGVDVLPRHQDRLLQSGFVQPASSGRRVAAPRRQERLR